MLASHKLSAIFEVWCLTTKLHDCCACTLRRFEVLSKLSWFPVSDYIKVMEYIGDSKFTEVYMCQILA